MRVLMFGPALEATSGISAVVNHWIDAGLASRVQLDYVSTLDDYVPGRYATKLCNAFRAYRVACTRQPAPYLVHLHVSQGMSFFRKLGLYLIARLRHLDVVVHLHGSSFKEFYVHGSALRRWLIRHMFDHATAVFVLSEAWRSFVAHISSNRQIHVLFNGAPIRPAKAVATADERIVITFMGRLGPRKGVYDLLQAFEKLSHTLPDAHLVLGGDGEIDEVTRRVRQMGLDDRVDVLGWVRGRTKLDAFDRADVYVLPSYNEGLPGSIVEAMACGKPIVSTPVGGIPEAVVDGVNGYLVNPGDVDALYARMLTLCEDRDLRTRMGAASRAIVQQKFDIIKVVERLTHLYDHVGRSGRLDRSARDVL